MSLKRLGLFLLLGSIGLTSCGTKGTIVAKVGNQTITLSELEKVYRPRIGLATRADSLADRKRALDDLIQKNLLALEARRLGLDKKPEVKTQIEFIGQELARNELYQDEIVKPTEPTEAGLKDFYNKQSEEIRCRHILVPADSEKLAAALLDSLKHGASFDSLARRHSIDQASAANGGDLGFFTYGMMVDAFWDAAAKLKPGQISGIVKTPYGLHIIRCEARRPRVQESFEKAKPALTQNFNQVMGMKRQQMTRDYIDGLKAKAKAKIDTGALALLASKVPKDTSQSLGEPQALPVLSDLEKKTVVLRFAGGTWTLERLLKEVEVLQTARGVRLPLDNKDQMANFLDQAFLSELLWEQAKAKGLDRSSKVQQDLATFSTDLLAGEAYQTLVDEKAKQISEDELKAYYAAQPDSFREPEQARVSRIIVKTEDEAKAVLADLKKGKKFEDEAKAKSIDQMTTQAGGDLGFLARGTFPELDAAIFSLKPKAFSGPIPFRGAFCILMVTERKEAREKSFDEARSDIQARVHAQKAKQYLEETTAGLKKKYPVTIDEQVLGKLGQDKTGVRIKG